MKLSAAGEAKFLRHVQRDVASAGGRVLLGIGDDAAVIACPEGHALVLTCDAAVAGRHFRREWFEPEAIGARAVAASVSDIAAMGAMPAAVLLTLAIS
ncbi:MAG TPA: AIR synthase related protein, partial [Dehalococcoidia bacterium]|nr:AIR synthase related protein [Dehalococcoidia bacterium]